MRSMSARSEDRASVWHYDGVSGVRRSPELVRTGDSFTLVERDGETGPWRFCDLVAYGELGGVPQYGLKKHRGWKIGFDQVPPAQVAALLPSARRYGGMIDRIGLFPALGIFAVLSVGIGYLLLSSPAVLARFVPMSAERELGGKALLAMDRWRCTTSEGDAALKTLMRRLGAPSDADVRIVKVPILNAFALPGGSVVLLSETLETANNPDEIAAVVGHELGHVYERHWMRDRIRNDGLKIVLGGFGRWPTDVSLRDITQGALLASYSRSDEAEADGYSIDMLHRAHISTRTGGVFFDTLRKEEEKHGALGTIAQWTSYGGTHPASADRKARFEAAERPGTTPALNAKQWQALRTICAGVAPPKTGIDF
jgi:hypothetical protein